MKYSISTDETDTDCYGCREIETSGYHHTGWYIYMPQSRRELIAKFLGLKSVYCVGVRNDSGNIYIQLSRNVDPRNNSLEYVKVNPEYNDTIMKIIKETITEEEEMEISREQNNLMSLAENGLL